MGKMCAYVLEVAMHKRKTSSTLPPLTLVVDYVRKHTPGFNPFSLRQKLEHLLNSSRSRHSATPCLRPAIYGDPNLEVTAERELHHLRQTTTVAIPAKNQRGRGDFRNEEQAQSTRLSQRIAPKHIPGKNSTSKQSSTSLLPDFAQAFF
jgi:hypothetical protein